MSFLNIQNLSKNYGTVPVLKNISLEIEEGGFLVLSAHQAAVNPLSSIQLQAWKQSTRAQ